MSSAASAFPHEGPPDPLAAGLDPQRLARVVALFTAQNERGAFPGGQLVARRNGRVAVDVAVGLACGLRAGETRVPATAQTRFNVHSASKPLVALAIALLEEDGRIDVTLPVVS